MSTAPLSVVICEQQAASNLDFTVYDWDSLAAGPTLGLPLPIVKIWIASATGQRMVTRLLESTEPTDRVSGVQRPVDYSDSINRRVWFAAG